MLCALALLMLGLVMVSSAGMRVQFVETPDDALAAETSWQAMQPTLEGVVRSRTMLYLVLALVAMGVGAMLPIGKLGEPGAGVQTPQQTRKAHVVLALGVGVLVAVLLVVYVPGLSREVNGSRRWIATSVPGLGQVSIQPSEIAKWAVIPLLAWYAVALGPHIGRFWKGLTPGLIAIGLVAGLIVLEDLGTGLLVAVTSVAILLGAGAKLWHLLWPAPFAAAGIVMAIWQNPYRIERITAFLDPYGDPRGTGYHMIQSMTAVAGGGGFGRGLGHGIQKFGYLPEDTNDFLFAIICEELGIAGAAIVITLLLVLLWSGLGIAMRQTNPMLKLIGMGIVATIGLQAAINLVVVTGLGPTKGIALPLVSSGGTGWILTAGCLGILIGMDRLIDEPSESELDMESTPMPAALAGS